MKTTRHLLITISCGDERCGFCVHRSEHQQLCALFFEPLVRAGDGKAPDALLRCAECVEAERKAPTVGGPRTRKGDPK